MIGSKWQTVCYKCEYGRLDAWNRPAIRRPVVEAKFSSSGSDRLAYSSSNFELKEKRLLNERVQRSLIRPNWVRPDHFGNPIRLLNCNLEPFVLWISKIPNNSQQRSSVSLRVALRHAHSVNAHDSEEEQFFDLPRGDSWESLQVANRELKRFFSCWNHCWIGRLNS